MLMLQASGRSQPAAAAAAATLTALCHNAKLRNCAVELELEPWKIILVVFVRLFCGDFR